jgi:excisionase family DNA binding protein
LVVDASSEQWLTINEVAAAWGVSRETVRRAIEDGSLPAWRLRTRYRIRPADASALLVPVIPPTKGALQPA